MATYHAWLALDRAMNPVAAPDTSMHSIHPAQWRQKYGGGSVGAFSWTDIVFPHLAAMDAIVLGRELRSVNQDVETFRADINARLSKGGSRIGELIAFASGKFAEFYGRWSEYFAEHQTLIESLGEVENFARLKGEYIALRSEWVDGLGQKTSAPSGKPSAFPWWIVPVGLAALAIVFVGPAVAPAIVGALAKKTAIKAAVAL